MQTFSRLSRIQYGAVVTALCMALVPRNAHAYLDPGTGSVVLQVLVAGVLGAIFTFKSYVRAISARISALFRKSDNKSDA